MSLNIRRVVTGLNADGKSAVMIDDIAKNKRSGRKNHESLVVWTTSETPADVESGDDAGDWTVSTPPIPNGSIFRITEYGPGVTSRMHSNETIDYTVIMSGEIDMLLEDGSEVHLKAGEGDARRPGPDPQVRPAGGWGRAMCSHTSSGASSGPYSCCCWSAW